MTQSVQIEDIGAVRIITMNRPDKLNALNTELTVGLIDALEAADADNAVRAVVIAGAGRGFCAGADLGEFAHLTPDNQSAVVHRAHLTCRLHELLPGISKPIVSAVQGPAMGGGAGIAIGCDMMVASEDLKLGYPELRHSMVPALVMTSLQRQLGRKAAFEIVSLGQPLNAARALELGLANYVVPRDAVLDRATAIAETWAKVKPAAMAATKGLFYRVAELPFAAAMQAGRDVNTIMRSFRDGDDA